MKYLMIAIALAVMTAGCDEKDKPQKRSVREGEAYYEGPVTLDRGNSNKNLDALVEAAKLKQHNVDKRDEFRERMTEYNRQNENRFRQVSDFDN